MTLQTHWISLEPGDIDLLEKHTPEDFPTELLTGILAYRHEPLSDRGRIDIPMSNEELQLTFTAVQELRIDYIVMPELEAHRLGWYD